MQGTGVAAGLVLTDVVVAYQAALKHRILTREGRDENDAYVYYGSCSLDLLRSKVMQS